MLVKFALELEAIDKNTTKQDLLLLKNKWRSFGILVFPGQQASTKIKRISQELNPGPREMWNKMWYEAGEGNPLLRWRTIKGDMFDWDAIQCGSDLAKHSEKFEVALLEETRASVLEIPAEEGRAFGDIEGIRFTDITLSEKFPRDFVSYISLGEKREDIWQDKFDRLAKYSKSIVIVDRYATEDQNVEGIFWFLKRMTESSGASRIQINSAVQGHPSQIEDRANRLKDTFESEFNNTKLTATDVNFFADDIFRDYAHDRHIRFDRHVVGIGVGPSALFRGEKVSQATKVSLEVSEGISDKTEEALMRNKHRLVLSFTLE